MILSRKTSLVGNLGGHSSSDKSLSGNEGDMTLQSVYDLCLSLCVQVSDQAKEIQHLKAQITKLKKQAKSVIKHHRAWLKSVSLKQRLTRKSFSKKQRVHKESVSKQGRKFAKVDHMETENAQDVGRTREIVDEEKEIDENILSTEDVLSTDKETVSTDKEKAAYPMNKIESTEEQIESTDGQRKDDETIAKVLLNMSQAKAVSREKEKGVRSEAIRNRPPTKNQLRNQMMTYLKHVENFKHSELKIKKFKEIQVLYEKIKRLDEDFISIGTAEDERLIKVE
ncbi:hypothetical protein Tco_0172695 [Tanacetum coccineum]